MFSVMLRRGEYFVHIFLSTQILFDVDKVQFEVGGDASYTAIEYPPHYKRWHEMQPWLKCSTVD